MIEQIDQRLRDWVKSALPGVTVSFDLTGAAAAETPTVRIVLLQITQKTAGTSGRQRPPAVFDLRYLIFADAETTEAAHRVLGQLLFAAAEADDFELEPSSLSLSEWSSLGVPPRPSFTIRLPLVKERKQPVAKMVREFSYSTIGVANLSGCIIGPANTPIAAARVEIPSLRRSTTTDHRGRFEFRTVPADPARINLRIVAKGRELLLPATALLEGEPAGTIYFPGLEE